jgi:GntR family transcriptional regulator
MTKTNDRADPSLPRYKWLAELIGETIDKNNFGDNEALPSERELAERYEVSRDTVRKTIRYLEERGIVYSDHGRGTFVAPKIVRHTSRYIDSFSQDTGRRGGVSGQRVLSVEHTGASMGIALLLGVAPGQPLVRVRRIRLIDDAPVGLHDAYFVLPPEAKLSRTQIEKAGSLYALLTEKFGFDPEEAVENLNASMADAEDAKLLGLEEGTPLLICERITLSCRRQPIEYCLMKYVPSYRYSTRISNRSGQ